MAQFLGFGRASGWGAPEQALSQLGVAARCTSLIAESLAALPLTVFELHEDGGREEARSHPLTAVLNDAANDRMPAFHLREALARDVLMGGNGYAHTIRDGRGRVAALDYMPARMVGVEQLSSGRLRYRWTHPTRGTLILLEEEVAHLRYASADGILGRSPLAWAHGAVGLAMAQSELAQIQVDRGFVPDVSFETDLSFGREDDATSNAAFNRLKRQLTERLRGARSEILPLMLESGLKAKPLAVSGREAQFHESRMAGLEDVARIYGVPLSVVGLGNPSSYGSLKEEGAALVRNCLAPWAARIEAQLNLSLLSTEGRRRYRIEHDLSGLLRGSLQERVTAWQVGITNSMFTPQEVRRWEGLSSEPPNGEVLIQPMNMGEHGRPPQEPPPA
ncbi:phage portal protein [Methylorubrum podarium]|uniref:phage portal protein n=1 Tax=Methylorubrum podarium TaxID=200476 RepID=UPI001EE353B7|nr:phage portal protein [Methylorubrum podarium]